MRFCRRVARQLFFERQKADKRHIKELRKGSVHNLLTTTLQKLLLSAAGMTLLTQPLLGASNITSFGKQTEITPDSTKKIYEIKTTAIRGENAFNAFKDFTLKSGETANLYFPDNTNNLVNFVKNKIDIQGTLNAIKNNVNDGNLFFVSSKGFVLGKNGVINCGAYYSLNRTQGFMDKFLQNDELNLYGVNDEIRSIVGSRIIPLGNKTSVTYDKAKKTHSITTTEIKNRNAFNSFYEFTLKSDEIANFQFPENTDKLLNFVRDKIDIQGTVNAIRDNRIGGDLYFLSSEGIILGKDGVINAGAFYAMTPTKGFMEKFIGKDELNLSHVDDQIDYIINRKISNYNERYDYGVTINPYGEITIEGKINTINGIGLYAGGYCKEKVDGEETTRSGLKVTNTAVLNTFAKDQLSSFVNLEGINLPEATDIIETEGKIELVSVQDNTHESTKIAEYLSGYSSFASANANAMLETDGEINSRNDVVISAYASNGRVNWIKKEEDGSKTREFEQVSNIASISSFVTVGGNITSASGSIQISAVSDNHNDLKSSNLCALSLELGGMFTPINVDGNVLKSYASSEVKVKENTKIDAHDCIAIVAKTNSSSVAGASTSWFFIDFLDNVPVPKWLPMFSFAVNILESSSRVTFDGTAISRLENPEDVKNKYKDDKDKMPNMIDPDKSISIISESNSSSSTSSTSKTTDSKAAAGLAFSLGNNKNLSEVNIGSKANFDSKTNIDISSVTNSDNSVTSTCELGKEAYAVPVAAVSIFNTDAIVNFQGNINSQNQVGTFSISVNNNIDKDEISAISGLDNSPWPFEWQQKWDEYPREALNKVFDGLGVSQHFQDMAPNDTVAKIGIAATVAVGMGKHNSTINILPNASINTTGDLAFSSLTYINDVHYDSIAKIACSTEQGGSKFESSIAFLYNDNAYTSNVVIYDSVIDESEKNNTQINGRNVSIESKVYQPYRRPQAMWEELLEIWEKIEFICSEAGREDLKNRIKESGDKFFSKRVDVSHLGNEGTSQSIEEFWRAGTDFIDSMTYAIKETVGTDGLIVNFVRVVKSLFEYADYSNFLNYCVSSSVNTTETGNNQPLALSGSFYIGNNSSKSNVYIGENANINASDSYGINIKSTSDVTTASMVGGPPILNNNNKAKNAAGGSVLVDYNSSDAGFLAAKGASIGSNNVGNLDINIMNNFLPVVITMGSSSITNGFNGMASALVGSSTSNLRIDDETNLGAKNLNLFSYNNTEADNIVGAFTLSEKKVSELVLL